MSHCPSFRIEADAAELSAAAGCTAVAGPARRRFAEAFVGSALATLQMLVAERLVDLELVTTSLIAWSGAVELVVVELLTAEAK